MILGPEWRRMTKFALVGVLNTGVDFAVFALLALAAGVPVLWAQVLSYGAGVVNSYIWNRRWTFQVTRRPHSGEWLRFAANQAAAFAAATAVLLLLAEKAEWPPLWAKAVSVAASLAVGYAGSRFWVFRLRPKKSIDVRGRAE